MSSPTKPRATLEILCVFSEVLPYAKTGGLGDVGGSLPPALDEVGLKVSTAMPLYKSAREKIRDAIVLEDHLSVEVPQRTYVFRVLSAPGPAGQRMLFFDCPELFERDGVYQHAGRDFSDNGLRYALFNKAVLEAVRQIPEVSADIFHVHDWQASFVPIFRATTYRDDPLISGTPTVLTIHNLGYQGLCDAWILDQLGLPTELYDNDLLEYHGRINPLKGGILYSDAITTVSRRYAREIEHARWGSGLQGVLRSRRRNLLGIVNGVDTELWDPRQDPELDAHFDADDLEGKAECRRFLRKELGLPQDEDRILIGFCGRLAEQKGIDLLIEAMESIARRDLQFVFLGTGEKTYKDQLEKAAARWPDKVAGITAYTERWAHLFSAGCDALLVPSRFEPCGLVQLHALRYGAVPIVHATGGLLDTVVDIDEEEGRGNGPTGFHFSEYTATGMLRALDRALEVWNDGDAWTEIRQRGMRQNFSWPASAKRYSMMFRRVHRDQAGKAPRDGHEDSGKKRVATTKGPFMEWGPPLPARYQEDVAILQPQGHSSLFLYWEVCAATRDRLQMQIESGLQLRVVLRDLDAGNELEEVLDVDFGDKWFQVSPTHSYQAELALVRESDGHWIWSLASVSVRMPSDCASPRVHEMWYPVGIPEGQTAPQGLLDVHGEVLGLDFPVAKAGPSRDVVRWQQPMQKVPRHSRDPEHPTFLGSPEAAYAPQSTPKPVRGNEVRPAEEPEDATESLPEGLPGRSVYEVDGEEGTPRSSEDPAAELNLYSEHPSSQSLARHSQDRTSIGLQRRGAMHAPREATSKDAESSK